TGGGFRIGNIPPGAVSFNGHNYLLVANGMSWPNAKAYCEGLGGHLVTIGSAAENALVNSMISSLVWIGFSDAAVENSFVWVTNEPVVYTNWGSGEPNNNAGVEDWTVMRPENGTWNDAGPDVFSFICEFDTSPTLVKLKNGD